MRQTQRRVRGNSTVNPLYHDPIPSVYRPPRAVPMHARIRGAAAVLAALAVESPRDTDQAHALAQMAQQLATMATGEARVPA